MGISILALVAAIVVPAYAALTKKDKKTVKNIANTEITKRAPGLAVASANTANTANSADTAGNASTAGNANQLGGDPPSAFVQTADNGAFIAPPEVTNAGGATNCFTNQWQDLSPNVNEAVGYARDAAGYVHLRGLAQRCGTATATMFTLPMGSRPGRLGRFAAVASTGLVEVDVNSSGAVNSPVAVDQWQTLDGITFRCAPSGSNGCP